MSYRSFGPVGAVMLLSFASLGWAQDRAAPVGDAVSFTLGTLRNSNVLAHVVCSFQHLNDQNPDALVFAEGDICAQGGGRCVYHALLNINGADIRLKQTAVSQRARTASFADPQYRLKVTYARKGPSTLTLSKAGKQVAAVKVKGDCVE